MKDNSSKNENSEKEIKRLNRIIDDQKELIKLLKYYLETFASNNVEMSEEQYIRLRNETMSNTIVQRFANKELDERFVSQMTLNRDYFFKYASYAKKLLLNFKFVDGEHYKVSDITEQMIQNFIDMTNDFFDDVCKLRNFYKTITEAENEEGVSNE